MQNGVVTTLAMRGLYYLSLNGIDLTYLLAAYLFLQTAGRTKS